MKKVLFWNYKYSDMKESWREQVIWLSKAFKSEGFTILKHSKFICKGLDCKIYDWKRDTDLDYVIYNHADLSHLTGNIAKAKKNLFFKPTVPTRYHATLDELGYGSFSSISYNKPNFEQVDENKVKKFFDIKVKNWIENKETKWGNYYSSEDEEIKEKDYYLVLGQCAGDEVVTRHDFGNYLTKLYQIVKELVRVGDKQIVIKLHPYMDGVNAKNDNFSRKIANELIKFGNKVTIYLGKSNIHKFLEKANCVILANSGSGFEAMMHHKPIIAWGYPEYHWVSYNLRHLADLIRAVKLDWFNEKLSDKFLYWYCEKYCIFDQQSTIRRVKELL